MMEKWDYTLHMMLKSIQLKGEMVFTFCISVLGMRENHASCFSTARLTANCRPRVETTERTRSPAPFGCHSHGRASGQNRYWNQHLNSLVSGCKGQGSIPLEALANSGLHFQSPAPRSLGRNVGYDLAIPVPGQT